ncbi:GDP-mannose 4,6-dehydratase [Edwardsiella tarda]|uniref:NAD-dependent epimerase/dehydratase family protein n=1 Tax=Edwardsiella tarda TaxID=636 RepID=UPI00351C68CB
MSGAGKHALVTGINGFTGRYVAAELSAAGYRVFGIGTMPYDGPDYYQVDLMDTAKLRDIVEFIQPNVVIHLAAIAYVGHGDADAFYKVNLLGTRNLLQALSTFNRPLDGVLLASSANIYGNGTAGQVRESAIPNPTNDYAVSKLAMEYMSRLWMDKLPVFITRPFNYTGVGQAENFLLPKIVKHFKSKSPTVELGNIDVWRDFMDVRALSNAYVKLLHAKPVGEVINICSGRIYSLRKVIELCEKITGHHLTIQVNPDFVRVNEVKTLSGDPSKLQSFIPDWNVPPLEDTLRWMLESE